MKGRERAQGLSFHNLSHRPLPTCKQSSSCCWFIVCYIVSPIVWFTRISGCEFKRTAICPLPSAFFIDVIATHPPYITGCQPQPVSPLGSFKHIFVDSIGGQVAVFLLTKSFSLVPSRVTKSENFPDSKIFVAKTFQIKRVNGVNFQIRDKCA